ncbi:MAG TPA: hypothetical protein VES96_02605 [Nitrospiraceae bacterium]|nr:hypothetical protein [Nitrospiraceae bacterium]
MRIFYPSPIRSSVITCWILASLLSATTALHADEIVFEVNEPSWIAKTLEHQMGKRVKLKLRSGQELEGTVAKVGAQAVHVTQLAGMDFYDAAVRLDDISAVIAKVRNK